MGTRNDEVEEIKTLVKHQLASIVWSPRTPKDRSSYLEEFAAHIRDKFGEPGERYSRELAEFSNLRNIALSVLTENSFRDNNSLKALKKYYCQLVSMLVRFKDSSAEFAWDDCSGRGVNVGNLNFELKIIMYNIAAIHNELGAKIPRSDDSNTKEALGHFSSALWWVTELNDNRDGPKPREMSPDVLKFYIYVLRGQAHECILARYLRKGADISAQAAAQVAAQVASDYEIALKQSPDDSLKKILNASPILFNWTATVNFKYKYYSAMAQALLGFAQRDDTDKEIGFRIARFRMAIQLLEPCKKIVPDTIDSATTKSAFEVIESLLSKKLDKAVRYNDVVYHAKIPSRDILPEVKCQSLISPAPFSISSIEFKDLFANLVTNEAVMANSIYSHMKDEISRQMKQDIERQDEELAQMMSTLNFDKRSLRLAPFEAPDELIEMCAELSMNPNIVDDILTKLEDLDDKSEEIQKLLDSVQEMLKRRPNREYQEELNRFRSTHDNALRTTQSLHKQLYPELQTTIQLMATTNNPQELLPKVSVNSAKDEEVISKLDNVLKGVDEMKQQRVSILNQLSKSLESDDITKQVNATSSEQERNNLYKEEIKKHDKYLELLKSNLNLQKNLLDTLEHVNANYGQVRLNHRAQKAAYVDKVDSLKKFYNKFKETSDGINQGLEYHNKMVELVRKFHSKVQTTNDFNDLLN